MFFFFSFFLANVNPSQNHRCLSGVHGVTTAEFRVSTFNMLISTPVLSNKLKSGINSAKSGRWESDFLKKSSAAMFLPGHTVASGLVSQLL